METPVSASFKSVDTILPICYNCTNIIDEQHAGVNVLSIWALIDQDQNFPFPDCSGLHVTIQDCWRASPRWNKRLSAACYAKCIFRIWRRRKTANSPISADIREIGSNPPKMLYTPLIM